MFEASAAVPSIWTSVNSWLSPTVLFVLLNVMIGIIALASSLTNQKQQTRDDQHHQQHPGLARSPSVLQRLRSFSLYSYRSQEPNSSFFHTTHFKPPSDSDTHYPSEHAHQHQTLETETQFISQQTHQQETLKTETQFVSQQTHQHATLKIETQFVPEQALEDDEEEEQRTMDEIYNQLNDHHVNRSKSDSKPAPSEVPRNPPEKMKKSASSKAAFGHFEEKEALEARRPATVRERNIRSAEEDEEVDAKADDFINRFKQQLKLQRLDSLLRYRGSGK